MITCKFIADYDKKEITWYFQERQHSFNAIVLADKEKGVSIKPYWDEEEKERFIELFVKFGNTREETIKAIEKPTFCFATMSSRSKVRDMKKAIANGNLDCLRSYSSNPVCPFA